MYRFERRINETVIDTGRNVSARCQGRTPGPFPGVDIVLNRGVL